MNGGATEALAGLAAECAGPGEIEIIHVKLWKETRP